METLLEAKEVTKIYEKSIRPSLSKVSFRVAEGEFIGIMGASGSGKTTLLNVLSTIDTPTSGEIWISGVNLNELSNTNAADFRKDHLGFIFQEYFLLDSLTIRENISVPLTLKKLPPKKIDSMVQSLAERFGIASQLNKYPNEQVTIITTGSQGEPMSALARMASSEHKKVNIIEGDTVILSATPIPGNEKLVSKVINQLFKKGAEVVYGKLADVHVSGHACQEELKLMQALVKPKFFIPVHGEYRHLKQHAELAVDVGLSEKNFMIAENGDVIEITRDSIKKNGSVTSGQIFVDGLGVGDVGNIVLRDRKHLSQDGILTVVVTISKETASVVAGPDIISRGFVYVRESEDLMDEAKEIVKDVLRDCEKKGICDWATMKSNIRDGLRSFLYEKTKRKPMILPIIMEI